VVPGISEAPEAVVNLFSKGGIGTGIGPGAG